MAFSSATDSVSVAAALLCTASISVAPNFLLFLFPTFGVDSPWLSLGQAIAAGGLLGDVLLHTIPHALLHGSGDSSLGPLVLIGFATFFVMDVIVRSHPHVRHHDHESNRRNSYGAMNGSGKGEHMRDLQTNEGYALLGNLPSTVVLNLAADSLHNFTDGLAIGVSFAVSSGPSRMTGDVTLNSAISAVLKRLRSRGGLAALSVMFHEVPHELGDFAILLSHGFSKQRAIMAQFGTAVAALCGTVVGIVAVSAANGVWAEHNMLLFTAGGFIYLAGCNIIPEILAGRAGWKLRLTQVGCFGIGVGIMYAVTFLEVCEHHSGSLDHGDHHAHTQIHEHHHHKEHEDHHAHSHIYEHHHHHEEL